MAKTLLFIINGSNNGAILHVGVSNNNLVKNATWIYNFQANYIVYY